MKMNRWFLRGMLGCLMLLVSSGGFIDHAAGDDQARQGVDVIFALDNSGSMMKNDPDFITRTVVINFLEGLDEGVRVGMVIFDTDAHLVQPLTGITTAESAESFLDGLDMITYKGQFTNTPAGVERAVYELKTNGREQVEKVVILLTDGIVDTGNKDQDLESEKWLKETLTLECKKLGHTDIRDCLHGASGFSPDANAGGDNRRGIFQSLHSRRGGIGFPDHRRYYFKTCHSGTSVSPANTRCPTAAG